MLSILRLKDKNDETFRSIIGLLDGMPRLRDFLDLSRGQVPDPSTVCKAMDPLAMALFQSLLQQTTSLHELGDVAVVDAPSFDRVAASRRYATRTDYRFRSLKTTILENCLTGTILDVHCVTTKPHDTNNWFAAAATDHRPDFHNTGR